MRIGVKLSCGRPVAGICSISVRVGGIGEPEIGCRGLFYERVLVRLEVGTRQADPILGFKAVVVKILVIRGIIGVIEVYVTDELFAVVIEMHVQLPVADVRSRREGLGHATAEEPDIVVVGDVEVPGPPGAVVWIVADLRRGHIVHRRKNLRRLEIREIHDLNGIIRNPDLGSVYEQPVYGFRVQHDNVDL